MKNLIILLAAVTIGFADWPQFQRGADNHGYDTTVFLNIPRIDTVFKLRVNKPVYAAPIIMGDTLFCAVSDGRVISINRKTGTIHWTFLVPAGIAATPAADGSKLYVGGRDGVIHAISRATGHEAWRFSVEDTLPAEKEIVAHLKLTPDRLYVGCSNGKLYCMGLNGNKKWDYKTSFYIKSAVAVKDSIVILSSTDEAMYCLTDKGDSCSVRWINRVSKYGDGYFETLTPRSTPLVTDTFIFCNYAEGEIGANSPQTRVLSLNTGNFIAKLDILLTPTGFAANSQGQVFYNIVCRSTNPFQGVYKKSDLKYQRSNAAPVLLGNYNVFHSSFYPTGIYFISTGQTVFKDSLRMAGYSLSSSFAAADSVLYFGTFEGYVFGMGTGQAPVYAAHDSLTTGAVHEGEPFMEPPRLAPNPFNPRIGISFTVAGSAPGEIAVYSASGRLVKSLFRSTIRPGRHRMAWDGTDNTGREVSSGLYLIRLRMGGAIAHYNALLIR